MFVEQPFGFYAVFARFAFAIIARASALMRDGHRHESHRSVSSAHFLNTTSRGSAASQRFAHTRTSVWCAAMRSSARNAQASTGSQTRRILEFIVDQIRTLIRAYFSIHGRDEFTGWATRSRIYSQLRSLPHSTPRNLMTTRAPDARRCCYSLRIDKSEAAVR